jgi:diaminohydroxyphosphoribosylaminopyrimidine deaminase/5-amino-6-(5-phosphoribosylamino)uracil reductase
MVDPNPIVASKGVAALRNSGIDVTVGVEEKLCQTMNEAYIHRILTGKPFITMRFSMSLDGGILDDLGDGAAEEGGYYSKMLQQYDGVIVSDQTLYDNLNLLSSEAGAKQPLRIVVTRHLSFQLIHLFSTLTLLQP